MEETKTTWFMGVKHTEDCEELHLLQTNDTQAVERHCKLIEKGITKHNCVKDNG